MEYIVFDVETPNCRNDRMSAIGITVVQDGEIRQEISTVVNPECRFDRFNIELTGITPGMAAEAPTFPEAWELIRPIMDRGILIAHNAPFDMKVLALCLEHYGICWKPVADYACTVRMSRAAFPQLPDHKLNTLCACLGIELDHHRAGSDSRACAEVLLACLKRGARIERFRRGYDLRQKRTV